MRRLYLVFLLLSSGLIYSQETLTVDAVSAMRVCGDKESAPGAPCATSPRPLNKISASYPEKARQARKEGTVTVAMTVGKDGSVGGVHVIKGIDPDMDQAAMDAVSKWKFDPGTYQGNAVDVELRVAVNFRLAATPQPAVAGGSQPEQGSSVDDSRNIYSDAMEAYNRGDYATSANLLRRVISIRPQNGSAWNDLGRSLLAMSQFDAAAEAFQTSIQKDPGSRNAYNNLGLAYWRQRKYEEAAAQFRKQLVVNPDDHYAHRNLGMMLRDQHRCSEAMAELQKALSLTPNYPEALLAEGECDLDLGNQAKGISELEQATSFSSAPNIFNSAAYALAKRNLETSMAEKWSDACLTIERTRLQNISLDHLSAEQLNYVFWMAAYWDTRGWIYFLRGDNGNARVYVESAWSLRPGPSIGFHLGQVYEKLGRMEDAIKVYAMAIASASEPTRARFDTDDLDYARKRLAELAGEKTDAMIAQGLADLRERSAVRIANEGAVSGSADFAVRLSPPGKTAEFRQLNGDQSVGKLAAALPGAKLPVFLPESGVEVPLRGKLTCHSEEKQCRFVFLGPEEAVNLVRDEMALASATPAMDATRDPHLYDDPTLGMRVFLPDEWKLIRLEPGSFSHPRNAMFGKTGSTAVFMLTREHFEGPVELFLKMIETTLSKKTDYKRVSEETIKRDGIAGTRWNLAWNEHGVVYSVVMEVFGVGDDYYRVTTISPKEVADRYAETFENVMRSVQFPMLRANTDFLNSAK